MKNLWKFMAAALLISMAGCEKTEPLEKPGETLPPVEEVAELDVIVQAPSVKGIEGSKTGNIQCFEWEESDKLIAVGFDGASCVGKSELAYESAADGKAQFKGKGLKNAVVYVLYYKTPTLSIDQKGQPSVNYAGQKYFTETSASFKQYVLAQTAILKEEAVVEGAEVNLEVKNTVHSFLLADINEKIGSVKKATWITNYGTADAMETVLVNEETGIENFKGKKLLFFFDNEGMASGNTVALKLEGQKNYLVSGANIYTSPYETGSMYQIAVGTENAEGVISTWKNLISLKEVWFKTVNDETIAIGELNAEKMQPYIESISTELNEDGYYVFTAKHDFEHFPKGALEKNTKVSELLFPEGMKTIGNYSMKACPNLKKVTLPESLEVLGEEALSKSGIEYLRIPANVSQILGSAVRECPNLKKVDCLAKAKKLFGSAFNSNPQLEEITLSAELEELDDWTFWLCKKLNKINIPANSKLRKVGMKSLGYVSDANKSNGWFFPEMKNLTKIGDSAFHASAITKIEIGDAEVGYEAFFGCSDAKSLTIGANVISFGQDPFQGVSALDDVTVLAGPGNNSIKPEVFSLMKDSQDKDYSSFALHLNKRWKDDPDPKNIGRRPEGKKWMGYTWKSIDFVESDGTPIK